MECALLLDLIFAALFRRKIRFSAIFRILPWVSSKEYRGLSGAEKASIWAMKQEGLSKVILEFERLVSTLSNPGIHLECTLLLDLIFAAIFRRKIRFFESF